jgi:hypothetical protein
MLIPFPSLPAKRRVHLAQLNEMLNKLFLTQLYQTTKVLEKKSHRFSRSLEPFWWGEAAKHSLPPLCLQLPQAYPSFALGEGPTGEARRSVLLKLDHRIDQRSPPMDCRFIRRCQLRLACCAVYQLH